MTRVLTSTANLAAAAGVSMEEMGGIMARAATGTSVYTDTINQLADRGIPIFQALADQMGVTTDDVKKLASEGKISFADFEKAAATAAGTVAEEMGKTVSGSLANFFASLGRIGANIMGPVFNSLAPLIQGVTGALAPLESAAKTLGETLGAWLVPKIEAIAGKLKEFGQAFKDGTANISGITGIIGPVTTALAALGAKGIAPVLAKLPLVGEVFAKLAPAIAGVTGPVGILVAALIGLVATNKPLRDAFGAALSGVFKALGDVMSALAPVLAALGSAFAAVTQAVAGILTVALQAITPLLTTIANVVGGLLVGALKLAAPLIQWLGEAFSSLVEYVTPLISALGEWLAPALEHIGEIAKDVFGQLGEWATSAIDTLTSVFSGVDLSCVWEGMKTYAAGLVDWWSGTGGRGLNNAWGLVKSVAYGVVEWLTALVVRG